MNGYRIAERARTDLQEIARYSRMRWGSRQLKTYMRQLASRFVWLAENPQIGKRRPDIGPKIESFPEGEHIIFYRTSTGGIEIVAVVHKSMDVNDLNLH